MANDLTWNQLKTDINVTDSITISGSEITIKINAVTGGTYASLDSVGVVEFIQKLLAVCNKTQNRINTGAEVGNRLAAFPNPNLGVPTKDSDGIFRVTSTQQAVSRLTVNTTNQIVGQVS